MFFSLLAVQGCYNNLPGCGTARCSVQDMHSYNLSFTTYFNSAWEPWLIYPVLSQPKQRGDNSSRLWKTCLKLGLRIPIDILLDLSCRLYCYPVDSTDRRSAQTVLHHTLEVMLRSFAPILPFFAEDCYHHRHATQLNQGM